MKRRGKSKVKKETVTPNKIELFIPGAEYEQTCTEDVIKAFKDAGELNSRKKKGLNF